MSEYGRIEGNGGVFMKLTSEQQKIYNQLKYDLLNSTSEKEALAWSEKIQSFLDSIDNSDIKKLNLTDIERAKYLLLKEKMLNSITVNEVRYYESQITQLLDLASNR